LSYTFDANGRVIKLVLHDKMTHIVR